MLNKTNGFKALMRFLKISYLHITVPDQVPTVDDFLKIFKKIKIDDMEFSTDEFKPGSGGEGKLYRLLLDKSNI